MLRVQSLSICKRKVARHSQKVEHRPRILIIEIPKRRRDGAVGEFPAAELRGGAADDRRDEGALRQVVDAWDSRLIRSNAGRHRRSRGGAESGGTARAPLGNRGGAADDRVASNVLKVLERSEVLISSLAGSI